MSSRRSDRAAQRCLVTAFWLPLAACTYLALTPSPPEAVSAVSDIVLHGFAFAYLTFALGLCHAEMRVPMLVACMFGYGVFIEMAQSLEATRDAELKDLAVDLVGIAAGLSLLNLIGDWSRRTVRSLLS